MSLWLPRPPPSFIARSSCSRPHYFTRLSYSRIAYIPLDTTRRAGIVGNRFQSTKPASAPAKLTANAANANPTVPADPATSSEVKPSPPANKEEPKGPLMSRVWKKVKHEAQHYWHGSKLLVSEVRISARLQWKILHGETLTRRERRQVRVLDIGIDSRQI